jgi:hypothetical protein
MGPRHFPGVGPTEPVVGRFLLPPVPHGLPEDAVFVAQAIPHGRDLHRGHRIEEAGGQAPETSVAEPCVGLLLQELEPVELPLLGRLSRQVIEKEVGDVVGERATDEEFHREVVDALRDLALVGLLRAHPSLGENVAHGAGHGLEALSSADRRIFHDVVEDEVSLVERIGRSGEPNWPGAVLLEKLRQVGSRRGGGSGRRVSFYAHRVRPSCGTWDAVPSMRRRG